LISPAATLSAKRRAWKKKKKKKKKKNKKNKKNKKKKKKKKRRRGREVKTGEREGAFPLSLPSTPPPLFSLKYQ
jgi:hypothetical protein